MKRIGFYTLSLAMLALLIFSLVEISARILFRDSSYNVQPLSEFQHDPTLGWKGIPGYRGKSPLSKASITINQYGFRDRDWENEMSRSISLELPRLLFIGDSWIYGYEIESDERLTEQLEYLYKSKGRAVSIFNAGIPAYGTSEEFRALGILFPILSPDVVFCMYSSNDIGDSALPYCWGDPKFRVYRCFYDVDGNLMLNQTVPRRFSLRIKGSLWEYLRLRFIIDTIESWVDDLRYSSLGISENRRIPVSNRSEDLIRLDRHVWDMGVVGYHPGFRDIYEKNKHRNFNLWKKMNDICRQHGKRFLILTHFSGDPDPMHPNQEIITFLKDHDIEFLNVGANNGDYDHWGYVNYDGHPNFLANYLKGLFAIVCG